MREGASPTTGDETKRAQRKLHDTHTSRPRYRQPHAPPTHSSAHNSLTLLAFSCLLVEIDKEDEDEDDIVTRRRRRGGFFFFSINPVALPLSFFRLLCSLCFRTTTRTINSGHLILTVLESRCCFRFSVVQINQWERLAHLCAVFFALCSHDLLWLLVAPQ